VIERLLGAVKYERLYRHDIGDGVALAHHIDDYRTTYNSIRPYQAIGMARPWNATGRPPTKHSRPEICLRYLTRDTSGELS